MKRSVPPSGSASRQRSRAELTELAARLAAAYSGRVPAGVVIACVTRSSEVLRRAGGDDDLVCRTEAMVRTQLDQRIPPQDEALEARSEWSSR